MEESNCNKCTKTLNNNFETVMCNGACNKKYHFKCVGFSASSLKFVNDNPNIVYVCDDCQNRPVAVLNKTVQNILNYMCIFDERFKRQENNSDQLFKEIGNITELLNDMVQNNNKAEEKSNQSEQSDKQTYAQQLKKGNYEPVVIVKPKKKQLSDETRSFMAEKFPNPQSVHISSVKDIPNGGLAINCKNDVESKRLQEEATKQLGDDYTVIIPSTKKPKIKIVGMKKRLSEENLIESIKEQNQNLINCDIKVIKVFENRIYKDIGAIIEIDNESFEKVMVDRKILIGWDTCIIDEYVNINRCFKCCGFNHKSTVCKNKQACIKCGDEHKIEVCKSEINKCINCTIVNNKWNLNLDANHQAKSKHCSVYKKKLEAQRKHLSYNQ